MNIKDWLKTNKMSSYALSQIAGLAPATVWNLIRNRSPVVKTVKKLIEVTSNFRIPITYDMFPGVYNQGKRSTVSGVDLFKSLIEKELKK